MSTDVRNSTETLPFNSPQRELGVLIGYDGSDHAQLALRYGARAAQRRGCPLTVVSAFTVPPMVYGTFAAIPEVSEEQVRRTTAEDMLDHARKQLEGYPGVVNYRTEQGDAAGVLVDLSARAQLAVVGARGHGGFFGRLLGSVASALPAHSKAPTVVVPTDYDAGDASSDGDVYAPVDDSRPVITGVDGTTQGRVAALEAAQAAEDRNVELWLTMALPSLESWGLYYPELVNQEHAAQEARKTELEKSLEAEAEWVHGHFPNVAVKVNVVAGSPVEVMVEETAEAQLTVMGTRGHGGFASAILGSTSRGVLYRAKGPLMVVPATEDPRLENQPEFKKGR